MKRVLMLLLTAAVIFTALALPVLGEESTEAETSEKEPGGFLSDVSMTTQTVITVGVVVLLFFAAVSAKRKK